MPPQTPLPVAASLLIARTDRVQSQGGAETDLITLRLPPGLLRNIGDCIRIVCAAALAANGNSKTDKLYFGSGGTPASGRTNASNNLPRMNHVWVFKRGINQQSACGLNHENGAASLVTLNDFTVNENEPILIRFTGQGVATGDIESRFLQVEYIPFNSNFNFF